MPLATCTASPVRAGPIIAAARCTSFRIFRAGVGARLCSTALGSIHTHLLAHWCSTILGIFTAAPAVAESTITARSSNWRHPQVVIGARACCIVSGAPRLTESLLQPVLYSTLRATSTVQLWVLWGRCVAG